MSEKSIEKSKFKQSPYSEKIGLTLPKIAVEELKKHELLGISTSEKVRTIVLRYLEEHKA